MSRERAMRRGLRFGAGVLLISAGIHAASHWQYYGNTASFDARRLEIMRTMQAYLVLPQWNVSLWTVLCMFSLAFGILLVLAGTAFWWMAKELPADRLRPLATASAILCLVGAGLVALLYPVPHGVLILLLPGLCFSYASMAGRRRI